MTNFAFFHQTSAIEMWPLLLLAAAIGVLCTLFCAERDMTDRNAILCGAAVFVVVACGGGPLLHNRMNELVMQHNAVALKWLKADAAHARISPSYSGDSYILEIATDPTLIVVGKAKVADVASPARSEYLELKSDQVAAFNAYVQTNFPELANAGGRVMGAVASNP